MQRRRVLISCLALALAAPCVQSADDTFVLTAGSIQPYTRTYLGNGYFSLSSSQWGTRPAQSFMIKVYDEGRDDNPRIAVLPAWNEIDVFNGQQWLNAATLEGGALRNWRQTVNMYDANLRTQYEWAEGGRVTEIDTEAFVSRANPNLAAVRLRVTPRYAGPIRILLPVRPWPAPTRLPIAKLTKLEPDASGKVPNTRYPGHMVVRDRSVTFSPDGALLRVVSQAEGRPTHVAEVVAVAWPESLGGLTVNSVISDELVGVEVLFQAEKGKSYEFVKYAGAAGSFETSAFTARAEQAASAAHVRGYDAIFEEHAARWHALWETDILVEGAPELQKVIHSQIFYLLGSAREGTEFNIPPMGLSTSGYNGHIFWDSDTFMYPPLLLLHPDIAHSLAMFRCNTLEASRRNALQFGYKGAMYPWEADETGREVTPRFAWENAESENHVTSDVALGIWQYYQATGDREFLNSCAYPVLQETADYWVSRSTYNRGKDRYEILKVVSPDEGSRGVNNDVVTNVGAKKILELAIHVSKQLGKVANPEWAKVMEKMYIVYDAQGEYFPEFEGAPAWKSHVGHVTPLIHYPFEYPSSERAKRNTLENALKSITSTGGGAYLLPGIYPVVAAEVGDKALVDDTLIRSYKPYMKPPFNVLNEGPRGESINFLTGTGFLQQFLFGYTGYRLSEAEGLAEKYKPILPSSIRKLTLRNIVVRGRKYDVVVEGNTLKRTVKEPARAQPAAAGR